VIFVKTDDLEDRIASIFRAKSPQANTNINLAGRLGEGDTILQNCCFYKNHTVSYPRRGHTLGWNFEAYGIVVRY
jgi:hypothetical protein